MSVDKNWKIKIVTDKPELFGQIDTIEYSNKIFSYFDKLKICELALKQIDNVVYIDVDSRINFDTLKTIKLEKSSGVVLLLLKIFNIV